MSSYPDPLALLDFPTPSVGCDAHPAAPVAYIVRSSCGCTALACDQCAYKAKLRDQCAAGGAAELYCPTCHAQPVRLLAIDPTHI